MKPMIPKRTRRLRARTATMNSREEEFEDYGPEPNMKLSHAFMVVLLLHVVAVGGLYAFNSMKHGKAASSKSERSTESASPQSSKDQDPGNAGGPVQEPPEVSKAPVVAKVGEIPKSVKPSAENVPNGAAKEAIAPGKGFLASARSLIQKTVGAAGIGGATKVAAQESAPAPVDQPKATGTEATPAPVTPTTYMVRAGDTLTRIAASLNVAIPDLEKVNGMTEKSVIQVGQVLKVPVKAAGDAASELSAQAGKVVGSVQQLPGAVAGAVDSATTAVGGGPANAAVAASGDQGPLTEYTIVKGDNPYKIAKKFKITPDQLMKANGITDPKKIQIGQKLKIPASTTSKKASR